MANKKGLIIAILITTIILGLLTGAVVCIYSQTSEFDEVFIDKVFVDNIEISGLTKEEAQTKIKDKISEESEGKSITVYYQDLSLEIPYEKFETSYNIDKVLEEGFKHGHEGNTFQRFRAFTSKDKQTYNLELTQSYNLNNVKKLLKEYSNSVYIAPKDAKMTRANKQFTISPDETGRQLDIKATADLIDKAFKSEETSKVEAVVTTLEAKRKPEFFANAQTPISSFYTTYTNKDPDRNYNLKHGAEVINTVIEPGAEFALSNFLEPITAEGGYKNSNVILNGELVDGIGGGVCQVATTLYNSVLLTELDITMRQNHSMPVGYIPLGRDATYASGLIDFKFKNPSDYPAYVESYCANNKLYVNIFGHESLKPNNDIKFESEVVENIDPPETKYENDSSLPKGEKIQKVSPRSGQRVKLYKLTYNNGELVSRKLESSSYYRPRAAVVRVGTKEVAPPPAPKPVEPVEPPVEEPQVEPEAQPQAEEIETAS